MSFASPIWLVGVLPWAALVAWLLIGRREQALVPFLRLWPTNAAPTRASRAYQPPPLALILILLAALLALIGAARPVLHAPQQGPLVNIIVDLHVTMAQKEQLIVQATNTILKTFGGFGPVDLVLVPDGRVQTSDRSDWAGIARGANLSSLLTLDLMRAAVRDALQRNDAPIIVISNQSLDIEEKRLIQVSDQNPPQNVGIVQFAARPGPQGQAMVTLRNQSTHTAAEIIIQTEAQTHRQPINLPSTGGEMNYFFDVSLPGRIVSVRVVAGDDVPADNHAWLVRQRSWPRVEAHAALQPELERMIDAYRRLRPSDEGSVRIILTMDPDTDLPAAVLASDAAAERILGDAPLHVEDHPINTNIDWRRITTGDARAAPFPGGSWRPIVSRGDYVHVAVRESPARQVWVGVISDRWPRESEFVIFWTNVFDWLGRSGGERFTAEPMRRMGSEWRRLDDLSGAAPLPLDPPPGVWGRDDGALVAMNVLDVRIDPVPETNWQDQLTAMRGATSSGWDLGPALFIGAMLAALAASVTWVPSRGAPAAA